MVQKGPDQPKWSKTLGSTIVDPFETLMSLPCLAIFGPSPVLYGGPESKRKAHHHQVSFVWPANRIPKHPIWNINMVAMSKIGQNSMKKWLFFDIFLPKWQIMSPSTLQYSPVQLSKPTTAKYRRAQPSTP